MAAQKEMKETSISLKPKALCNYQAGLTGDFGRDNRIEQEQFWVLRMGLTTEVTEDTEKEN